MIASLGTCRPIAGLPIGGQVSPESSSSILRPVSATRLDVGATHSLQTEGAPANTNPYSPGIVHAVTLLSCDYRVGPD
jgi:hypothetical protein